MVNPILELKAFCRKSNHPILHSNQVLELIESVYQFELRGLKADQSATLKILCNFLAESLPARDQRLLYCEALINEYSDNFKVAAQKCRSLIALDRTAIEAYDVLVRIEEKFREQPSKLTILSDKINYLRRNAWLILGNIFRTSYRKIYTISRTATRFILFRALTDTVFLILGFAIPILTLMFLLETTTPRTISEVGPVFGLAILTGVLLACLFLPLAGLRGYLQGLENHAAYYRNHEAIRIRERNKCLSSIVWGLLGMAVLTAPIIILFKLIATPQVVVNWGERAEFLDPNKEIRITVANGESTASQLKKQLAFNKELSEYKAKRELEINKPEQQIQEKLEKIKKQTVEKRTKLNQELESLRNRLEQKYQIKESP